MKKMIFVVLIFLIFSCDKKIELNQELPKDAVVENITILISDFEKKEPQTIEFNDGKVVTFKMPDKLNDGAVIKIGKLKDSDFTYFVKVKIVDDRKE